MQQAYDVDNMGIVASLYKVLGAVFSCCQGVNTARKEKSRGIDHGNVLRLTSSPLLREGIPTAAEFSTKLAYPSVASAGSCYRLSLSFIRQVLWALSTFVQQLLRLFGLLR